MTNEEKFIDTAENYLSGNLADSQKSAFEAQLDNDPEAASAFQLLQMMREGIRENAEVDFKAQLKDIHNSIDFSEETVAVAASKSSSSLKTILLSILAIVAIGLALFFLLPTKKSTEKIIQENSKPPILALLERSTDATTLKEETAVLWSKKEYANAIPNLEELTKKGDIDNSFVLALGYSYFANHQYDNAKIEFQKLITAQDFLYADQASWYLALIALEENEEDKAFEILDGLSNDNASDRKADAMRLLKDLGM